MMIPKEQFDAWKRRRKRAYIRGIELHYWLTGVNKWKILWSAIKVFFGKKPRISLYVPADLIDYIRRY